VPKVFNYTDRVAIPKQCIISKTLVTEADEVYLEVAWDFSTLELPSDAVVTTEVSAIGTFRSVFFEHGLIGSAVLPKTRIRVTELRNPDLIKFRIKVTKKNAEGIPLIIADIDKVSPTLDKKWENGSSLLKRRKVDHLMVPWELQFELGVPVLCISGQKDLWYQLLNRAPWFDPIALTAIVETVFLWSLVEKAAPEDSEVFEQWKKYFISLGCSEEFYSRSFDSISLFGDEVNDIREMANLVASNFCHRFKFLELLSTICESDGNR